MKKLLKSKWMFAVLDYLGFMGIIVMFSAVVALCLTPNFITGSFSHLFLVTMAGFVTVLFVDLFLSVMKLYREAIKSIKNRVNAEIAIEKFPHKYMIYATADKAASDLLASLQAVDNGNPPEIKEIKGESYSSMAEVKAHNILKERENITAAIPGNIDDILEEGKELIKHSINKPTVITAEPEIKKVDPFSMPTALTIAEDIAYFENLLEGVKDDTARAGLQKRVDLLKDARDIYQEQEQK